MITHILAGLLHYKAQHRLEIFLFCLARGRPWQARMTLEMGLDLAGAERGRWVGRLHAAD